MRSIGDFILRLPFIKRRLEENDTNYFLVVNKDEFEKIVFDMGISGNAFLLKTMTELVENRQINNDHDIVMISHRHNDFKGCLEVCNNRNLKTVILK